jgi:hypothetical protein
VTGPVLSGSFSGPVDFTNTGGGDSIKIGDISGSSGVAIGRNAQSTVRNVSTGGGDYAEGNLDKRSGDTFSGNFSGAILNVRSTLTNVTQSIGAAPQLPQDTKTQLTQLIQQLSTALQQVPASSSADAEQVSKRAEAAIAEATKPQPDKEDANYSLERLTKAAQNLALVVPTILPIATQIADTIRRVVGF